jgi:hypothetical protein
VLAATAIEGNTLSEAEVLRHLRGELELPPSRQYLEREIEVARHRVPAPHECGPLLKSLCEWLNPAYS